MRMLDVTMADTLARHLYRWAESHKLSKDQMAPLTHAMAQLYCPYRVGDLLYHRGHYARVEAIECGHTRMDALKKACVVDWKISMIRAFPGKWGWYEEISLRHYDSRGKALDKMPLLWYPTGAGPADDVTKRYRAVLRHRGQEWLAKNSKPVEEKTRTSKKKGRN